MAARGESRQGEAMIYFIRMADSSYYKIGYTSKADANQRIASIQTSCPRKVIVQAIGKGSEKDEQLLHIYVWQYKTDGGEEWFDLPEQVVIQLIERLGDDGQQKIQRGFSGTSPFDVRPLRGGQQHEVTNGRENVSHPRSAFDDACAKRNVPVVRRKH